MPITDYGLLQFGSYVRGLSPSYPQYVEFGFGSAAFDGSYSHLGSGFYRKALTWSWAGTRPQASCILLTTDANGSTIGEIGMGPSSSVGSDLFNRELSAIGDKNDSFSTTLTFDVRFSRP